MASTSPSMAAGRSSTSSDDNSNASSPPPPDRLTNILQIINCIVLFFLFQNIVGSMVQKFMVPPPPSQPSFNNAIGKTNTNSVAMMQNHRPYQHGKPSCLWEQGTVMDLDVVISDSSTPPRGWRLTSPAAEKERRADAADHQDALEGRANPRRTKVTLSKQHENAPLATWRQENLILGGIQSKHGHAAPSIMNLFSSSNNQEMNHRNTTLTVPMTNALWNNETHLYAYVRLMRRRVPRTNNGQKGVQKDSGVRSEDVLIKRVELTRHRKRKRKSDEKSLLDTPQANEIENNKNPQIPKSQVDNTLLTLASQNKTHDQILLYIKPSLTLQMVDLGTAVEFPNRESIPRQFAEHMDWYEGEEGAPTSGAAVGSGGGTMHYPILYVSEFWITYDSLKAVNGGLKESKINVVYEPVPMWKWQLQAGMEDSQRKQEAFHGEEDTSNDMLRTMLVETNPYLLANKKSMEGLSLRSMIVNCFFSLVILLYLADNDTSFMVLASNSVGLLIDMWKISKAIRIKFEGGKIEWVEAQSYKKSRTKEYDEIATSHLLFVTMPLVAGYGMYSLFFQKHKGWYSWVLNTLVGFIYMFGFVMMTPQLFINYKLQSVAHLNWRTMTYKSINTFIDDLFAFVIKMPIMHRLACLRDDVIFFIFCYQRYKYKTDYTRVNEFGQCVEPTDEMLEERHYEEAAAALNNVAVDNSADKKAAELEKAIDRPVEQGAVRRRRGA
eukprot:CCRYP_015647-RB/>CCRYP_015647-RB protein AED:0.07 eAED:0.07 QI:143/0.85/0.75/1/1/1/8/1476/721